MKHMKHMKDKRRIFGKDVVNAFYRLGYELLPPLRRSPSLEEGGLWGGKIESWRNIGGRALRARSSPTL